MSAKKQGKRPTKKEFEKEVTETLSKLFEERFPAEFREFAERVLNPEKAAEAKRKEEEAQRLGKFITSIPKIRAGYKLPAGFAKMWETLLAVYEQETRERFIASGSVPTHLNAWIKRGWITADVDALVLRSHIKEPAPDLHPIPAVLINNEGHWTAPTMLNQIVKVHPFIRAVTTKLPTLSVERQIARAMKWAETCRKEGDYHGIILAQAADSLDLFLYEQMFGDPKEFGWLQSAKASEQFWLILNAAIGFGRSLANYEIYGDGAVKTLIQKALLLSIGRRATDWRKAIDKLLEDFRVANGFEATAMQLLTWVGGKRPKDSDSSPIVFQDERGEIVRGITWSDWNETVKSAKKKRK